jgi:hypothetical protein
VRLANGSIRTAERRRYEAHGIGKKKSSVNAIWSMIMTDQNHQSLRFAVCIHSADYPVSELHKIYRVSFSEP